VRRLPPDPTRRKYSFEIVLMAEREGIFTVPPFAVAVDGEKVMTSPLRLQIRAPRPATEMALSITVEPTQLRVGQPATVTVTWTSEAPLGRCKQLLLEIPLLADARCQLFPLDPPVEEAQRTGLPVNNMRVFAQSGTSADKRQFLSFRYMLIPRQPCILSARPARLVCALLEADPPPDQGPNYFYKQFFSAPNDKETYERIYLAAPLPEITVAAITAAGRNGRYAEIVGPCALRTTVVPEHLSVGQAALLTVHLDDMAFARHITALPAAALAGLGPEFQISAAPIRETSADRSRSFTHILRPLRAGIARIPAVVIQTFNPDSGEYQTLRSTPLAITVEPDRENASRTVTPRNNSKPPSPLSGIRHNRLHEPTMMSVCNTFAFFGRFWWALLPLPPLVWLALLPLARRWDRCRRDPLYARAVGALWRFRTTAWRNEETAWRNYLADRLALCAEALTAETVAEALRAREVDVNLVAETRRRFEERDAAEYGNRPTAPSASTHRLVRRLHKATVPLLLVCSLWTPLRGSAAENPDDLFARAIQMREEKPDAAQPLLAEAALCFESAERFLNAGNAWFFTGENGRALANYRAAERRSPFDGQLRESIEFLRANRADSFPPSASPPGRVAAVWMRFCTWSTVLRVGLFVLAYLIVWTCFVAAQLLGWRVRRAVWIALVVAALVPLASVVQSGSQPDEGVVIEDGVARLGPGYAYDPAFEHPLHKATEFLWLETRQGWVRVRLPDATEAWLHESDCMKVQ
jgi:hypothetical protein